ncbi:MAG: LPS export ABC transporter periplasmic protein LptC [Rickettsiaceae bacterium]|nr:LPS export ABC transporter periplasmic protein LptC [Rickettsiaceae bacterium]
MYRRNVRIYKAISIGAVGLVLLSIIYILLSEPNDKVVESSQGGTKGSISIKKSVLNGADENGNIYVIKSKEVQKKEANLYDLIDISGFYNLGKAGLDMIANFGILNDQSKILHLRKDITLEYLGYKLKSNEMDLNLSDMSIYSNDPVSVVYGGSEISAGSFAVDNSKKIIHFKGNVKTHVKISDFK